MPGLEYQRVLIKLSGEAIGGAGGGIKPGRLRLVVDEVRSLRKLGAEVAIVVGAGNIWRKRTHGQGLAPATADYLGLLATVMNGLALKDALRQARLPVRLQSAVALGLPGVESLDAVVARGSLRRRQVVIFAGGTGKPFFTTDTAAAQRARDIRAELIIKAGPVDGVYTADPNRFPRAQKYHQLTLAQAIKAKLQVMDKQAFNICRQYNIPVIVCRWQKGVLAKVVQGKIIGTLVKP